MIREVRVRRCALPLKEPYKLAFGAVEHFDTIFVEVWSDRGYGIGEATLLTGYTDETIEQSHAAVLAAAALLPGHPSRLAAPDLIERLTDLPFTATAMVTAIEMAAGHPLLRPGSQVTAPLLAGLNATDEAGIVRELEAAIESGFGTLKVKVGFDAVADLRRVALIQRLNRGRLRLRIDGNQGYDRDDAVMFASSLDPAAIELLEQPTAASDWDAARAVAAASTVPLMLDEAIYRLADIDRAAAVGARFVKLKLMKRASLDRLVVGLERIHALGMTAVLGNGVATDIGCWMETCIAARCVKSAGEMNGFRRLARTVVPRPMTVERGVVSIPRDFIPELDEAALSGVTLADARFSRGREWRTEAATA